MPRFLSRLTGISLQTELLMMTLIGLANNIPDWRSFNWSHQLQEIENLHLIESDVEWAKITLKWIVIARILVVHVHTFSYLMNFYSILTWSRPQLLLPGIVVSFFKNLVLDGLILFVGIVLWREGKIPSLLIIEFVIVKTIPLGLSGYNWWSTVGFFKELRRVEKLRKMRRALLHKDSKFGGKPNTEDDSFHDGSWTLLTKRQRCVSFLSFDDFFCQTSLDSLEVDQRISKSLTTLLTLSSAYTDETEDAALQIIDDPDLSPLEKSMRILGITDEDVRIARAKSRYTLAEGMNRRETTTDIGGEEMIFWKEDGQTQTGRYKKDFEERRRKRRDVVEEIVPGKDERDCIQELSHEEVILKDIIEMDEEDEDDKASQGENNDQSWNDVAGAIEKVTSTMEDIGSEKPDEEEVAKVIEEQQSIETVDIPKEIVHEENDENMQETFMDEPIGGEVDLEEYETITECINAGDCQRTENEDKNDEDKKEEEKEEIKKYSDTDVNEPFHPCDPFTGKQEIVHIDNTKDSISMNEDKPSRKTSNQMFVDWRMCECFDEMESYKGDSESTKSSSSAMFMHNENNTVSNTEKETGYNLQNNSHQSNETTNVFKITCDTDSITKRNGDMNVFIGNDIKFAKEDRTRTVCNKKHNPDSFVVKMKSKIKNLSLSLYNNIPLPFQFFISINEQFKANLCPPVENYDYFESLLKFPFSTNEMCRRYSQGQDYFEKEVSEDHCLVRQFQTGNRETNKVSESRLFGGYLFTSISNVNNFKRLKDLHRVKHPVFFPTDTIERHNPLLCPTLWPSLINQGTQFEKVEENWNIDKHIRNSRKRSKKDISTQVKTVRRSKLPLKLPQTTGGLAIDSYKFPKYQAQKHHTNSRTLKTTGTICDPNEIHSGEAVKCAPRDQITGHSNVANNTVEELNPRLGFTFHDYYKPTEAWRKCSFAYEKRDNDFDDGDSSFSTMRSPKVDDEKCHSLNGSNDLHHEQQSLLSKPPAYPRLNQVKKFMPNCRAVQDDSELVQDKLTNIQVQCSGLAKTRRKSETIDERKARELKALKAYNKVTLLEDKRRLEAERKTCSFSNGLEDIAKTSIDVQYSGNLNCLRNDNSNVKEIVADPIRTNNKLTDVDESQSFPSQSPKMLRESRTMDEGNDFRVENEPSIDHERHNENESQIEVDIDRSTVNNNDPNQDRIRGIGSCTSLSFSDDKQFSSKLQNIDSSTAEMLLELLQSYEVPLLKQELKRIQETRNQDTRKGYMGYNSPPREGETLYSSAVVCIGVEDVRTSRNLEIARAKEDVKKETSEPLQSHDIMVSSIIEGNCGNTIKSCTGDTADIPPALLVESIAVVPGETMASKQQEGELGTILQQENHEQSINLETYLRKSIDLNLPDIVRDISWSVQHGGIVLSNKNLMQRCTNLETLQEVYARDIIDDETANFVHRAFFFRPEIIIRTFGQGGTRVVDEISSVFEEAISTIYQDSSVNDTIIRDVDEMDWIGGEEIYNSNLDNNQVNINDLGNALSRGLWNSQDSDPEVILIIEEESSPIQYNRSGMNETVQDFPSNVENVERNDCALTNRNSSATFQRNNACNISNVVEHFWNIPIAFWVNFVDRLEITQNPEEGQIIKNNEEILEISENFEERAGVSTPNSLEDEVSSNIESPGVIKMSGAHLVPTESFDIQHGPSMAIKIQDTTNIQRSFNKTYENVHKTVRSITPHGKDEEAQGQSGNIVNSPKVFKTKNVKCKDTTKINPQENSLSFPTQFEYTVAPHQPRRGLSLSSGYLMDFDSEGNLVVPQPTISTNPSIISEQLSTISGRSVKNSTKPLHVQKTLPISPASKTSLLPYNDSKRMIEYNRCVASDSLDTNHEKCQRQHNEELEKSVKKVEKIKLGKAFDVEEEEIKSSNFIGKDPISGEVTNGQNTIMFTNNDVEIEHNRLPLETILMFSQIVFVFYFQYFLNYFRHSSSVKLTKSTFTSGCYDVRTVSTSTSRLFESYVPINIPDNWKFSEKCDKYVNNSSRSSTIISTMSSENLRAQVQTKAKLDPHSTINLTEEIKEITSEIRNIFSNLIDRFVDFVEDGPCELPSENCRSNNEEPERQRSFSLLENSYEDMVKTHDEIDLEKPRESKDFVSRIEEAVDEFPEVKSKCTESVAGKEDTLTYKESKTILTTMPKVSVYEEIVFKVSFETDDSVENIKENVESSCTTKEGRAESLLTPVDSAEKEDSRPLDEYREINASKTTNFDVTEEKHCVNSAEPRFEDDDSFDSTYTQGSAESGNEISSIESSSMEEFSRNTLTISSTSQNSRTESVVEEREESSQNSSRI